MFSSNFICFTDLVPDVEHLRLMSRFKIEIVNAMQMLVMFKFRFIRSNCSHSYVPIIWDRCLNAIRNRTRSVGIDRLFGRGVLLVRIWDQKDVWVKLLSLRWLVFKSRIRLGHRQELSVCYRLNYLLFLMRWLGWVRGKKRGAALAEGLSQHLLHLITIGTPSMNLTFDVQEDV